MYRACANFNIWAIQAAHKRVDRKKEHSRSSRPNSEAPSRASSLDNGLLNHEDHAAANEEGLPLDYDMESEASSSDSSDVEDGGQEAGSLITVTGVERHFGHSSIVRERVSPRGVRLL